MAQRISLEARISKLEKVNCAPTVLVFVGDGETAEEALGRTYLQQSNVRPVFIIDEFPCTLGLESIRLKTA